MIVTSDPSVTAVLISKDKVPLEEVTFAFKTVVVALKIRVESLAPE